MRTVPSHWSTLSLARITVLRCDGPFGSSIKSENYVESGVRVIRLQNVGSAEFRGDDAAFLDEHYVRSEIGDGHWVEPGDVLIAGLGDENNPLGRACTAPPSLGLAIVKADCYRFRLDRSRADPAFVALQLASSAEAECGAMATGSTRSRLNLGLASSRIVALPPTLEEQRLIVGWIGREAARIDALIEKKTRFIELLREKRLALIQHAIARGMRSDVALTPTGVEWLGHVPEHWRVVALGYVAEVDSGATPDRDTSSYWGGGIPWVKTGEINYLPISCSEESISPEGLRASFNTTGAAGDFADGDVWAGRH